MLTWRTLRVQLMLSFLAAILVVLMVELVVLYVAGGRACEGLLTESNRILARSIRNQLDQGFHQGISAATALALDMSINRSDPNQRQIALHSFLSYGELFSNAYVFDSKGRLILFEYAEKNRMTRAHLGDDYHDRPGVFSRAADQALATGKATFTPIYHTPTGRPQVSYLVPLLGQDKKPVELISLALYAVSDRVEEWLKELAPAGGYLAVLDTNNRLLALTGTAPEPFKKAGTGGVPGVTVPAHEQHAVMEIAGREDLVNTAPIPGTGFHVWVGVPRTVVYAPLEKLRKPLLLAGLLALLVGILGIWRRSRGIVASVSELVSGIRRVGEGVLSHRVPEGRSDELGAAAVAFNRMAARLQRDQLVEEIWRKVHHS